MLSPLTSNRCHPIVDLRSTCISTSGPLVTLRWLDSFNSSTEYIHFQVDFFIKAIPQVHGKKRSGTYTLAKLSYFNEMQQVSRKAELSAPQLPFRGNTSVAIKIETNAFLKQTSCNYVSSATSFSVISFEN